MGVTRLKRKDRRNKTVSRLEQQILKMNTNKAIKKPITREAFEAEHKAWLAENAK